MATTMTQLASSDRWEDVQHSLSGGGDGHGCQCVWPVLRDKDFNATTLDERRDMLHDEIAAGPPPGLVAYVDGEAAGWIRIVPRTRQLRILHTRAIVTATKEPLDDDTVWAVTCFIVRREHRGQGLNARLLSAAIDYARASGARLIEAYPVDTSEGSHHPNELYHGTLSTFLAAGFTAQTTFKPGRVIVTRGLAPESSTPEH